MIRFNKTLVALVGAVAIPLGLLLYLASLPGGGRGSLALILLQVAIVVGSVVLFAVFLARFAQQVNERRVRRWLETRDGQQWLAELSGDDRATFLARLDGAIEASDASERAFSVDSSDPSQ